MARHGRGGGMRISDFSIDRPMVTVVAMLALVVFGLFALVALKTDEFPDIDQPVIVVGIPYPGAAPEGVEREIVDRVEEAITGIAGIRELRSSASDGYAQLIVFFEFGKNMPEASQEIRDRISAIRDRLPDEMKEPVLTRVDPADIPVVSLTLASDRHTPVELTRLADPGIARELRQVPGVAQVDVAGGQARERERVGDAGLERLAEQSLIRVDDGSEGREAVRGGHRRGG